MKGQKSRPWSISKFADFVRTGYPEGMPRTGHVPLFALLRRRLGDDEIPFVADMIKVGPPIMQADIHAAITRLLGEVPLATDAERVSLHLAEAGWLVVDASGRPVRCPASSMQSVQPQAGPHSGESADMRGPQLVERMAHSAMELAAPQSIEDAFADVCAAAVELIPGADLADIMLVRDGDVVSIGATSELSARLDELQQQLGEGPCAQAAADTAVVRTDDFSTDNRWTNYAPAAVELGVRSCLSFKLYSAGTSAATMNIFGFDADVWDDDAETVGAVLAAHAASAIDASRWGAAMSSTLADRDRIASAKGIIMERYGVDALCAFTMMRRLSQETDISLTEVAQRVIATRTPSAVN
jgi:GAF domain-containing protein